MKASDIMFTVCAAALSIGLLGTLYETFSVHMPLDLKDPKWGTLPDFEAALRPIARGISRETALQILANKPFAITNGTDITCLWQSQPHGWGNQPTLRRFTYQFDSDGVMTNTVMRDNESDDYVCGHGRLITIIWR